MLYNGDAYADGVDGEQLNCCNLKLVDYQVYHMPEDDMVDMEVHGLCQIPSFAFTLCICCFDSEIHVMPRLD